MHKSIAQRRAILEGLRDRCSMSTAEFYAKTNRLAPIIIPRFNVIPNGNNQFGIVESETGMVREVCVGHNAACKAARLLEQAPKGPGFATLMLNWTCAFVVILLLFAAYGSLP